LDIVKNTLVDFKFFCDILEIHLYKKHTRIKDGELGADKAGRNRAEKILVEVLAGDISGRRGCFVADRILLLLEREYVRLEIHGRRKGGVESGARSEQVFRRRIGYSQLNCFLINNKYR